jgi:hypothetical protein
MREPWNKGEGANGGNGQCQCGVPREEADAWMKEVCSIFFFTFEAYGRRHGPR